MNAKLSLHVPQPPARPGEPADFSYLKLAPAGAAPRPAPNASIEATTELATSLIRILDDEGRTGLEMTGLRFEQDIEIEQGSSA